jgi:hypothetical protein
MEERYEYCVRKTRLKTGICGGVRDGDSVASDLLGNINHETYCKIYWISTITTLDPRLLFYFAVFSCTL